MKVLLSLVVFLISLAPMYAIGARGDVTILGKVQTYTCVLEKKACAESPNDPVAMAEDCFVVLLPNGEYYFISNVACKFMAGIATETVRVTGLKDPKYNAIRANTIEVIRDGKSKEVFMRASEFNPPPSK